jgi:hypothetical protein
MPKVKSNKSRVRKFRTPNSALLTKYEKIALLSPVYSLSETIQKLGGSYGTISSANEFFESTKETDFQNEWTLNALGDSVSTDSGFGIGNIIEKEVIVRVSGFYNKHPNFEIENIEKFNQYLADKLSENPNFVFKFKLQHYGYGFKDLSIIQIEDLTAIFQALIGEKGFNTQIRSRYKDTLELDRTHSCLVYRPKEEFIIPETHRKEKIKVIATKDNLILL